MDKYRLYQGWAKLVHHMKFAPALQLLLFEIMTWHLVETDQTYGGPIFFFSTDLNSTTQNYPKTMYFKAIFVWLSKSSSLNSKSDADPGSDRNFFFLNGYKFYIIYVTNMKIFNVLA